MSFVTRYPPCLSIGPTFSIIFLLLQRTSLSFTFFIRFNSRGLWLSLCGQKVCLYSFWAASLPPLVRFHFIFDFDKETLLIHTGLFNFFPLYNLNIFYFSTALFWLLQSSYSSLQQPHFVRFVLQGPLPNVCSVHVNVPFPLHKCSYIPGFPLVVVNPKVIADCWTNCCYFPNMEVTSLFCTSSCLALNMILQIKHCVVSLATGFAAQILYFPTSWANNSSSDNSMYPHAE